METRLVAIALFVIVIVGIIFVLLQNSSSQPIFTTANSTTTSQGQNSTQVLFATSQYAQYAYLVSGLNLTQQESTALSGYTLKRVALQNGSVEITIHVNGTTSNQSITLSSGYKIYIIETSFGDDSQGRDFSYGDDTFILVDPNGYIV